MIKPLDIPRTLVGTGFRITSSVVSTAAKPAGALAGRVLGSDPEDAPTVPTPRKATPEPTPAELAAKGEGRRPAPFGSHEPGSGS